MKPSLVLIYNNGVAVRYVDGKQTGEKVQLAFDTPYEQQKREIEYFRKNGFDSPEKEV